MLQFTGENSMNPFRVVCQKKYLVLFLLIALGMAACGQKGDLYLPDQKQSSQSRSLNAA